MSLPLDVVPNRTSRPTCLLREFYRDGACVRTSTLANLSTLSDEQIDAIRAVLRGEPQRPVGELFEAIRSLPHGSVPVVSVALHKLDFARWLSSRAQPERDLCARWWPRAFPHPARHYALVAHHDVGVAVRGGTGGRG